MTDHISMEEAAKIVKRNLVTCVINAGIRWGDDWVFSAFTEDPDEGEMDPFYSVNIKTGEFSGFSIVGDQDTAAILDAFSESVKHSTDSYNSIMHYGVLGMRWGVRKDRSSGSGKSSGKKTGPSTTSVVTESVLNTVKPMIAPLIPRAAPVSKALSAGASYLASPGGKAALQTSAKAAFTGPQAIAGYAITGLDSGAYRVPFVATKNLARGGWKKDPSLASKDLDVAGIQKKVVSGINKDYPGLGTTNNCLRATYTYEMRRRGYDVAATKTLLASGQTSLGPRVMTKSLKVQTKIKTSRELTRFDKVFGNKRPSEADVFRVLSKQPNGSRGDFQMRWGPMMGGHSVAYEIVKGKPVIFDTQSGKVYSSPRQLQSLTRRARSFSYNRLDNKDLNSVAIAAWVKDSK